MTRSIPEWVGKTDDAAIPPRVKLRVFEAWEGRCYICKRKLGVGGEAWDCDHEAPLWDGGEHRESNLRPACTVCHQGKTAGEASQRAEAKRHKVKRAGIKTKKRKMPYRRFNGDPVWPD